ncbi:hypothetical protein [Saccharibacillus qingshengii]|uniref:hypothetical protein n=1 Tax=Saccharibacillus qingshengii TaxID=1763540 RepID=UPI001552E47B|nr:hypothetical protein [Saccharibacillus qingshengii]
MKNRFFFLLFFVLLLTACSSINSAPDSVVEGKNEITATKQIADSNFEIRLIVARLEDTSNTFDLEASIRYTGEEQEITISHGDPLFTAELKIDGKQIGGPIGVSTVEERSLLKSNEWQTQTIILQSSQTQIKQFFKQNGEIIINAGFSAEGYNPEHGAFLSLKAEEIQP